MQTKDMKKDYEVAVLDPAGNVTAIVLSDVPAAERARAAARLLRLPELHIEQVAFLTAPARRGKPASLPRSAGPRAFSRSWRTRRRGRRPR